MKNQIVAALTFASASAFALVAHAASVGITNTDSATHKILISSDDKCFSGTHTSIGGNTTTTIEVGYLCVEEQKPAYKVEAGKTYIIKDGRISVKP